MKRMRKRRDDEITGKEEEFRWSEKRKRRK